MAAETTRPVPERPRTRREMRRIWAEEDARRTEREQAGDGAVASSGDASDGADRANASLETLRVAAVPGGRLVRDTMRPTTELPGGRPRRPRRRLRGLRSALVLGIAGGIGLTAAMPAYAVSPAVAATNDMTRMSPEALAYQEAALVDSGTLQSGALLASSASAVVLDGDDLLTAEERVTARLSSDTASTRCTVGGGSLDGVQTVIPLPAGTYTVTSRITQRWGRMHNGVDMAAPLGTTIVAALSGTVVKVDNTYGTPFIGIRSYLPDGTQVDHLYIHMPLSSALVKVGDTVEAGQPIAGVGNEGRSTGPHLHFEVHLNGGSGDVWPGGSGQIIDGLDWLEGRGAASVTGC